MIRFDCDYLEGAHPAILQKLVETNMDQTIGYGEDPYCAAAAEKIRKVCQTPDAAVHFLVGGTQTNTTVINSKTAQETTDSIDYTSPFFHQQISGFDCKQIFLPFSIHQFYRMQQLLICSGDTG